jgi:nucleotide-binding universal stress UspA family protein
MTYDTVLVPTDGGQPSERAAVHAADLASTYDATIHALYVLDGTELPPNVEDAGQNPQLEEKRRRAFDAVIEAAEDDDVPEVVEAAVVGETAPAIRGYADEHDADLIVMGTHGRSGLDRLVVGSVAETVIRQSEVPVVTVRPTSGDT